MKAGIDLLNSVFSSAAEGIIISNRKGEITLSNPKSEEMFGYKKGEMIGLTIEELVPMNIKHNHSDLRDTFIKSPTPRPMGFGRDLEGLRKDGQVFPLEIGLSYFEQDNEKYVAAFITDITERKKSEKRLSEYTTKLEQKVKERTQELEHLNMGLLRENEERKAVEEKLRESQLMYELIAKNFPNGVISVLDKNYCYLFIEGKEFKTNKKPSVGEHFVLKFPLSIRESIEQQLFQVIRGETRTLEFNLNEKYFIIHFVPITDVQNRVDKILIVEENISELKKAEIEIRANLEREKELNVMKSRFVSMASHEFRTPLSTVLSSVNLISKYQKTEEQPKRDKHINRISTAVKNLTDILNDFLSLERLESGAIQKEIKEVSLEDLFNEIIEQMQSLLKAGQTLLDQIQIDSPIVQSDSKLLKNIVINLLSNAIKYSDEDQEIMLVVNSNSNRLTIQVVDKGMGIPESEQKNLFQRFFRAGNAVNIQGTGLGLHIVKKYVDLLNGSIELESQENKGTSITIEIPHE